LVREAFDYSLMRGNFHPRIASQPNVGKDGAFPEEK
jgi:hypothetical protein